MERPRSEVRSTREVGTPPQLAEAEAPHPSSVLRHCTGAFALRHALIVCNSYANSKNKLDYSVSTGRKLQRSLIRCGFKACLCEDIDGEAFETQLSALSSKLESQPEEEHLVFFYFAGHGAELDGELMMKMQGDQTDGFSLRFVLKKLLQAAPDVGVVAVPDCCRENSADGSFRLAPVSEEAMRKKSGGSSLDLAGNFYVVWAGDRGTRIADADEDNLGFQMAALLKESRGRTLEEVLQLLGHLG